MTTIDQELIDIALEALSNHKVDIDKAKKDISTVNSTVKKVDSSLKASIGNLADKLSVVDKDIPNLVKEEVAKIPVPKNGRDGKDFDVEAVKPIIADKVQEVEKKAIDKIHKAIKAIPKPKDGKDGRNGLNGKSGKDGRDGKSIKGDKGSKGVPGVGIEDITASNDRIKVKLTDGKVKEVIIPKFVAPSTGIVAPVGNLEIQTLRNLADTAVNNAENGQTLVYNNGMWVATTPETPSMPPAVSNVRLAVRVKEAMDAGTPVMYDSYNSGTNTIEVVKADSTLGVAIGITETDLEFNAVGTIITSGTLEGIDTSGYTEGQILYTGTSGQLTSVEPAVGFSQPIAFVLRSQQNNGAILITTDYPKQGAEDVRYGNTTVAAALDAVSAGNIESFQNRAEIESMFKTAEGTSYKELIYDQGNITNIDIYTDSSKAVKLFSKIIGYNNGNIISVSITDEVNGGTLDKTIAYVDGNISSISSTYTI